MLQNSPPVGINDIMIRLEKRGAMHLLMYMCSQTALPVAMVTVYLNVARRKNSVPALEARERIGLRTSTSV